MAWLLNLPRRDFDRGGVAKRRGRVPRTDRRKCLSCLKPFDSTGPGNRMCVECRRKPTDFLAVYA